MSNSDSDSDNTGIVQSIVNTGICNSIGSGNSNVQIVSGKRKLNGLKQTISIGSTGSFTGIQIDSDSKKRKIEGTQTTSNVTRTETINGRKTFADMKYSGLQMTGNDITFSGVTYWNTEQDPLTKDQEATLRFAENYPKMIIHRNKMIVMDTIMEITNGIIKIEDGLVFINNELKLDLNDAKKDVIIELAPTRTQSCSKPTYGCTCHCHRGGRNSRGCDCLQRNRGEYCSRCRDDMRATYCCKCRNP